MSGPPPVSLLWLVFKNHDLGATILFFDASADRCPGDDWRANPGRSIATDHQHAIEGELRAGLGWELLDRQSVTDCHPILLATCFNDGVRGWCGMCIRLWVSICRSSRHRRFQSLSLTGARTSRRSQNTKSRELGAPAKSEYTTYDTTEAPPAHG